MSQGLFERWLEIERSSGRPMTEKKKVTVKTKETNVPGKTPPNPTANAPVNSHQ